MNSRYETTDFWLAAFLKASGLKILDVQRGGGRSTFIFEDSEHRQTLIRDFYNDGVIKINAYKNALQDIKSIIHNF